MRPFLDRFESDRVLLMFVETKQEMCTDCVSVLWAQGTPRGHFLPEYGLRLVAEKDVAVLERPKKNVHGTEAAQTDGSKWGRTAIAAFEAWGSGGQNRKAAQ